MLSILIPVYNHDIVKLVKELHDQCVRAKIGFEILVFDDGSNEKFRASNQAISGLFCVNYVELSSNQGRSKIRNRLARTAGLPYLLFLDADSKIPSRKFIKNYIPHLEDAQIVCGGRTYKKNPPRSKNKYLHWLYGSKQESRSPKIRNKRASRYFHTNNFVIPRQLMLQLPFDEDINSYGYEDILFAHQIELQRKVILHINNPVIHGEIESTESFLKKQDQALINLKTIVKSNPDIPIKLWQLYNKLKSYGLQHLVYRLLGPSPVLRKRLMKNKRSLRLLRNYRLSKFYEIMNK